MGEADGRPLTGAQSNGRGLPIESPIRARPRPSLWIVLVPFLVVLITFLFWYDTWLGRPLSARQMTADLSPQADPRDTQHALAVLAERIERGDQKARQWYPEVVALSSSKIPQLRIMAAWVMGQDNGSGAFHAALKNMLTDSDPMAEWNAALALSRFDDAAGDAQLRAMLEPYPLQTSAAGAIHWLVRSGQKVHRDTPIARIAVAGHGPLVIPSPLAGKIDAIEPSNGGRVQSGEKIATILPGNQQVLEALQALYLVGKKSDLGDIEHVAQDSAGYSTEVREQAHLAAQAIEAREDSAAASTSSNQ